MKSNQLHLNTVLLVHLATICSATPTAYLAIASLCRDAPMWTLISNNQHCERFFVCTGREDRSFQEFRCPGGYHFNSEYSRCVRGSCDDLAVATCNGIDRITVRRLEGDCTRFERCWGRARPVIIECGDGLYFDVERNTCLPVHITPAHQCSCILPENSTQPNPEDCTTFYRCAQGRAELQQCPRGYYFEPYVNSCLLDTRGKCLKDLSAVPVGHALQECEMEGSSVVPHSHDCSRYFVCIGHRALELHCPKGEYFDVVLRYCVLDTHFRCRGPTKGTQTTSTTAPVEVQQIDSTEKTDMQIPPDRISKLTQQANGNKPKLNSSIHSKLSSKFLLS